MTKGTWMRVFSFLFGMLLVSVIALPAKVVFSSALSSDDPKMTAAIVQDINPGNQIAGTYSVQSSTPPDRFHGIFATPVPELAVIFLLGFIINAFWGGTRKLRRN